MRRTTALSDAEERITEVDVKTYGIKAYDLDNAYPQRMQRLVNACSSAKQAVGLLAKFIIGQGFDIELSADFYKSKINSKGLTPDKLLRRNAADKALFRGFAIHVNYNALFEISSVNYVPFEHCRLGSDDNAGKICVYPNWEARAFKKNILKKDIRVIDMFDPNPDVIINQVNAAGGWLQYKGQIYWHSDDFEAYPLASIDTVLESMKAEIASDKTTTNNLKNNFAAKVMYIEKGKSADDDQREEFKGDLKKFIGPDGLPIMLVEVEEESEIPELRFFDSNLNDKLFQYTDTKTRQKIYRAFNQHSSLHSDMEGTGFNAQNLRDTYAAYNGFTNDERILMEEVYSEIFSRFHAEINPGGNYTIKRIQYLEDLKVSTNNSNQTGGTNA